MEEVTIYKYQAECIEDTLRQVANLLKSYNKTTCLDRNVMQAKAMIENALAGEKDKKVSRF